MHPRSALALGVSAAVMVLGVLLAGTEQNPWNLAMAYFIPVGVLEALATRPTPWRYAVAAIACGSAMYGAVWTLGAEHALLPSAGLVYTGLAGAVLSSAVMPARLREPQPPQSL